MLSRQVKRFWFRRLGGSLQGEALLRNLEVYGELILLTLVGALFAYMIWESFDWRYEAKLAPRIVIGVGTPFWLIRVFALARILATRARSQGGYGGVRDEEASAGQIMDMGFYLSAGAGLRFFIGSGSIVAFVVAVWLLGWHIAIPGYIVLYLRFVAKLKWWLAISLAAGFGGGVMLLYDTLMNTNWNEPVLLKLLKSA